MYQVVCQDGNCHILRDGAFLQTPGGKPVCTPSEPLARRLAAQLEKYGESPDELRSLALFHYPWLDFTAHFRQASATAQALAQLKPGEDWTLRCPYPEQEQRKRWERLWGEPQRRMVEGKDWILTLRPSQLCAALTLARILDSMNVAYLATQPGGKREARQLLRNVQLYRPEWGKRPLEELLDNFLFYWQN